MSDSSARCFPVRARSATSMSFLAVVAVLELPGPVPSAAETPPPYRYDATNCENSYYLIPTSAERARAEVPARFGILGEAAGLAIAGVLFTTCDVSLNGEPAGRASWSDVGVLIDPPSGVLEESPAIHVYRAWNLSNLAAMVALNTEWGIETGETDVETAYAPGVPVATTVGFVDASHGAYGGQGYFGGYVHPGAEGVVSWWSLGTAGLVRFDQAYTNDTEQCGVGAVTGEGRLGRLIGGTGVGAHGCVVFADLTGIATLVEPVP